MAEPYFRDVPITLAASASRRVKSRSSPLGVGVGSPRVGTGAPYRAFSRRSLPALSPNRTCTFRRIRLSIKHSSLTQWATFLCISTFFEASRRRLSSLVRFKLCTVSDCLPSPCEYQVDHPRFHFFALRRRLCLCFRIRLGITLDSGKRTLRLGATCRAISISSNNSASNK